MDGVKVALYLFIDGGSEVEAKRCKWEGRLSTT